jgi:hypothetical protein
MTPGGDGACWGPDPGGRFGPFGHFRAFGHFWPFGHRGRTHGEGGAARQAQLEGEESAWRLSGAGAEADVEGQAGAGGSCASRRLFENNHGPHRGL